MPELMEGQRQIDALINEQSDAPGLRAVLAALTVATDYTDLRARLASAVREHDLRDHISALENQIHAAEHIGRESIDHDLPIVGRAEVDAHDRRMHQADKVKQVRETQQRAANLAKAASSYALFAVARYLWDVAVDTGQPLELYRQELTTRLQLDTWGADGSKWAIARAEPLQRAFTHARVRRLSDEALRGVYPVWAADPVLDGGTTSGCRALGQVVRPAMADDFPVPPLHWGCRTTVRGLGRAQGEPLIGDAKVPVIQDGSGNWALNLFPDSGPEELLAAYRWRL